MTLKYGLLRHQYCDFEYLCTSWSPDDNDLPKPVQSISCQLNIMSFRSPYQPKIMLRDTTALHFLQNFHFLKPQTFMMFIGSSRQVAERTHTWPTDNNTLNHNPMKQKWSSPQYTPSGTEYYTPSSPNPKIP